MLFVGGMAPGEFPSLLSHLMEALPLACLGLAKCLLWPLGATSVLSPVRANSPPPAPQLGVAEAGLQRAILQRAQEILAVAKTIPGTTSSCLSGFSMRFTLTAGT